ncbi:hypothetical protein SLA2020_435910 [Shorea laevis]
MKGAEIFSFLSLYLKPSRNPKPIFNLSVNLEILETHLNEFQNLKQFDQILSQMILTGFMGYTFAANRLLNFSTSSPFIHLHHSPRIFYHFENPNGFVY